MSIKRIMLTDPKKIAAYRNPIRYQIMSIMRRKDVPMTVNMVAKEMKMIHGNVYYHMKKLIDVKLIEIVETKSVNGIIAKYYSRVYDQIFWDLDKTSKKVDAEIGELNHIIYTTVFEDFTNEVFPVEMNIEDPDIYNDAVNRNYYKFEPNDTEKIKKEVMDVFLKYHKDTEKSISYNTIIAIGKTRKQKYKTEEIITIEDKEI